MPTSLYLLFVFNRWYAYVDVLNRYQISAPALQECTNSHTFGIANAFSVGPSRRSDWPESPEDYAVLAIRLQHEQSLRESYRPQIQSAKIFANRQSSYSKQLINYLVKLKKPGNL